MLLSVKKKVRASSWTSSYLSCAAEICVMKEKQRLVWKILVMWENTHTGQGECQHLGAVHFGYVHHAFAKFSSSHGWESDGVVFWISGHEGRAEPGSVAQASAWHLLDESFRRCLQEKGRWSQPSQPVPWAPWNLEHTIGVILSLSWSALRAVSRGHRVLQRSA